MFGIGMPEMILILAVALIVIGPKKLPDLAKSLGKAMGECKKATRDLKESMQIDTELKEVKSAFDDIGKDAPPTVSTAADRSGEPPVEDDGAGMPPESGDTAGTRSMDQLKSAFDRRNVDGDVSPAGDDEARGNDGPGPDTDSETQKA